MILANENRQRHSVVKQARKLPVFPRAPHDCVQKGRILSLERPFTQLLEK